MRDRQIPILWGLSGVVAGVALTVVVALTSPTGPKLWSALILIPLGAAVALCLWRAISRSHARLLTAVRNTERRQTAALTDAVAQVVQSVEAQGSTMTDTMAEQELRLADLRRELDKLGGRLRAADARTTLAIESAALLHGDQLDALRRHIDGGDRVTTKSPRNGVNRE